MSPPGPDLLFEAALTAHRGRDREGRLTPPPAWFDLPAESLDALFAWQTLVREAERVLDPEGDSATVKAVRARLGL